MDREQITINAFQEEDSYEHVQLGIGNNGKSFSHIYRLVIT